MRHLVIPPGAGALCLGPVLHPHGPRAGAVDPLRGRAESCGRAGTEAPEESDGDPGRCPTLEVKGWLEWNGMDLKVNPKKVKKIQKVIYNHIATTALCSL